MNELKNYQTYVMPELPGAHEGVILYTYLNYIRRLQSTSAAYLGLSASLVHLTYNKQ